MIKSKTKIEKGIKRKTNKELIETIILGKKNKNWLSVSSVLSSPVKKQMNLGEIDKKTKEGDKIVFAGKILSEGELTKEITIIATKCSEKAKEKILNSKSSFTRIIDEIKTNPEAKGVRVLE
jgi:ribosomal protein L18E